MFNAFVSGNALITAEPLRRYPHSAFSGTRNTFCGSTDDEITNNPLIRICENIINEDQESGPSLPYALAGNAESTMSETPDQMGKYQE